MTVDEFVAVLNQSVMHAIGCSHKRQHNKAEGNCVLVLGITGRKRQRAIKMGAVAVDVGLVFHPTYARMSARGIKGWATAFATAMCKAGFHAYVMMDVTEVV